ncbi:MAG: hypothetical protein NTW19_13635 [Planctomycetota bacterium]|nr:hypothetical protein [Planctomycetota bacterium]
MNNLRIETLDNQTSFAPGSPIAGIATWQMEAAPGAVEVRLFWFTDGKGDRDVGVVDRVRFDNPSAADAQPFAFTLPAGPYSFSGKLISLQWALEVVVLPGEHATRLEIVVSPTGAELDLTTLGGQPDRNADGKGPTR